MKIALIILFLSKFLEVLALSQKTALCYIISGFDSGVSGYIYFNQQSKESKLTFKTEIYGTDKIEDFGLYIHNKDFDESCSNFPNAQLKYTPIFNNKSDLQSINETIIAEGEIPEASLFSFESSFYDTVCYLGIKHSRKNRARGILDEESYKVGGCGKMQYYDSFVGFAFGLGLTFVGLLFIVVYFLVNKI